MEGRVLRIAAAPPMWISGKGDREVPGGFVDATHNLSHRGARLVE